MSVVIVGRRGPHSHPRVGSAIGCWHPIGVTVRVVECLVGVLAQTVGDGSVGQGAVELCARADAEFGEDFAGVLMDSIDASTKARPIFAPRHG
jgi:hypothetical protein